MKWYSYVKALGIVTISKIILSSYKILTRSLPDPYHSDHVATSTRDTSITSKGYVVEQRNADKKNSAINGVWEGEIAVDSWPFTVSICTPLLDMIKVSLILEQTPITQCYDETTEVTINGGIPYPCRNFVFCNGTKLGTLIIKVSCDPNVFPE